MFLIRRMSFSAFFLPHLWRYFRKIGVGFGSHIIYFCQAKFVSKRKSLLINTCTSSLQLCKAASSEGKTSAPGHSVAGLEDKTMFLRLGNAPFGSDSKVLRPISMVFPVVNALKRFKSLGNQKRSLFSKPIAIRRSTAAMIDILLILNSATL